MKTVSQFIGQFLLRPDVTGAIAPSSAALAEQITDWIDLRQAGAVVEFGPGTGAFTGMIKKKISPQAIFFAVEINPYFVKVLQDKHPDVSVYHDCVENAHHYLKQHGVEQCDCIVSGLPWAAFSQELQECLLDSVYEVLKPGGQFVTFAYLQGLLLKSGRSFRHRLHNRFSEVTTSKIVWRNLPPAFVYQVTK